MSTLSFCVRSGLRARPGCLIDLQKRKEYSYSVKISTFSREWEQLSAVVDRKNIV